MINRRLLRIKTLQILFAYFKSGNTSLDISRKELFFSIHKTYELYYYLFLLVSEVIDYAETKIDVRRNKKLKTNEDSNPNLRLVENRFIAKLKNTDEFLRFVRNEKLSWVNDTKLIAKIYNNIIASDYYKIYMEKPESDFTEDKHIIKKILENEITILESYYETLDEKSIYWGYDTEYVLNMMIKTVKQSKSEDVEIKLMPEFKNNEDKEFVDLLFRKAILNHKENVDLISKHTKNWDIDRIAFMDVLLMEMAIVEATEINSVPLKVSLNEYIDLSKMFSTGRSSNFINGLLDKIFAELRRNNKIQKTGRGLVE